MTIWRKVDWERKYKERLGHDVFKFIEKDKTLITYLSDYDYVLNEIKNRASSFQLDDNSILVIHICKFFEGVLILIANETGWLPTFSSGKSEFIRKFYLDNRSNIVSEIKKQCPSRSQKIEDKLFSTVEDFTERHNAVHYGSMLSLGEVDNYDAILTKTRDVIKILLENGLIN